MSIILLTITEAGALTSGEYLKVNAIDATDNQFNVTYADEEPTSTNITFYYEVFN